MTAQEERELYELFIQSFDSLRERTLHEILAEDEEYQEVSLAEDEAEKAYLEMELDQAQRQVIDELLRRKEYSGLLYADAAYLAGVKNVLRLQRLLRA